MDLGGISTTSIKPVRIEVVLTKTSGVVALELFLFKVTAPLLMRSQCD